MDMWKNRWISWRYKRLLPSEHFSSSVCFSFFPLFSLFGAFWRGFSSIFRFVCFFSVNEWMKDSLTIPLAVRCLFFQRFIFSIWSRIHRTDEGESIYFVLSQIVTFRVFFLLVRTKILRQIIAASYYILWTQVGSIIGFKSDAHLEAIQKNQVYRSNLRAIGFAFSPWK